MANQDVFITFALGAKEAYFFNSPRMWARNNLPPQIEALFTKTPPIKDILELALGEKGSWFVTFREEDGNIGCLHYNIPNPLTTYLYSSSPNITRTLSSLSVTLGPYESYFATDITTASWSNLPPALEKALLHRIEFHDQVTGEVRWKDGGRERPCFVSLGADGTFFMRTVGGGGCWDVKGKLGGNVGEGLKGIDGFLEQSRDFNGIVGLYLFPSSPQSYILLLTSGKAYSNLPEHTWIDYKKMENSFPNLSGVPRPPSFQQQPVMAATGSGCCGPQVLQMQNCCPPQQVVMPMVQPVQMQMVPQIMPLQQQQMPMMQPMQQPVLQPLQTGVIPAAMPQQIHQPMQPMQPPPLQPLQPVNTGSSYYASSPPVPGTPLPRYTSPVGGVPGMGIPVPQSPVQVQIVPGQPVGLGMQPQVQVPRYA